MIHPLPETQLLNDIQPLSLVSLPDEILLNLFDYFLLEDLRNISSVCRRLHSTSYTHLRRHIELKRRYWRLNDPFQGSPCGWLEPLISLLRGEFPREYVEEVIIVQSEWFWRDLPAYDDFQQSQAGRHPLPFSAADMVLVERAVEDSPWITPHDACGSWAQAMDTAHFLREIRQGDQDNILAILLPLLPNLKRLQLPKEIDSDGIPLGSVLGVVYRIACRIPFPGPVADDEMPFRNLQHIESVRRGVFPYEGSDLLQISPFMALDSLRTVKIGETWQSSFRWSARLPKSNVRLVEFEGGDVQIGAVQGLAKGLQSRCVFRHKRRTRHGQGPPSRSCWTVASINDNGGVDVMETV